MDVQMYWLLVVKEYIIRLSDIVSKVKQCIGIAATRWIAKEHPSQRQIILDPRPECMIVNLIDPDHV